MKALEYMLDETGTRIMVDYNCKQCGFRHGSNELCVIDWNKSLEIHNAKMTKIAKEQKSPELVFHQEAGLVSPEFAKMITMKREVEAKLEKAKAFIKAECYCEMDGDIPKHCKNCQFLEGIDG